MAPAKSGSLRVKKIANLQEPRDDEGIMVLRYEETTPAKAPIPVTVAPPRAPPTDLHPALRRPVGGLQEEDEWKRDSGLAPTTSSKAREGSVNTVEENTPVVSMKLHSNSISESKSIPHTPTHVLSSTALAKSESTGSGSASRWRRPGSSRKGTNPETPSKKMKSTSEDQFSPITTSIPTESLLEEDFLDKLSFSKRGSMMLGGKKAVDRQPRVSGGRK
jgi:hypothetical protein